MKKQVAKDTNQDSGKMLGTKTCPVKYYNRMMLWAN